MNDIRQRSADRNTLLAIAKQVEAYDPRSCGDNRAFERPIEDRIDRLIGTRPDEATIAYLTSGWSASGYEADRFITSLDAALKAAPDSPEYPGHRTYLVDAAAQTSPHPVIAYVWTDTGKHVGRGFTPCTSLLAAGLRARAAGLPA